METWDVLRARRNVREYEDRPIAGEDLDRILEAGRRAPSAGNSQPWDLVLVTDRAALERLAGASQGAGHVARSAATVALVAPIREGGRRDWLQFDLGQATMAMMLAAADLGIGSGHAAVSQQGVAGDLLGFPDDHFCAYLVAFGYPDGRPLRPIENPKRRPFDEVVHRGRW